MNINFLTYSRNPQNALKTVHKLLILLVILLVSILIPLEARSQPKSKKHTTAALGISASAPVLSAPGLSVPEVYSVLNLNSGEYLEGVNTQTPHSIASLTKLMTAYVLLKNVRLETCFTAITQEDRDDLKGTHTKFPLDHPMSCQKLLQAMLIASDNWAASALANVIPGKSRAEFIALMNQEAKNLGMRQTQFADSSGLSPLNTATAHDLNILLSKVVNVPLISDITSKKEMVSLSSDGEISYMTNTNKLVRELNYPSLLSKTGYIKESKYNLIFVPAYLCAKKNIAIVIMGAKSSAARSDFAQNIMNKYNCRAES